MSSLKTFTIVDLRTMVDALPLEQKLWLVGYLVSSAGQLLLTETATVMREVLSDEDRDTLMSELSRSPAPPVADADYNAVTFGEDLWRAVVASRLQRPSFNSKGAALAFASAVARGARKPEPA